MPRRKCAYFVWQVGKVRSLDHNVDGKHCCISIAALNRIVLSTATIGSRIKRKCIVAASGNAVDILILFTLTCVAQQSKECIVASIWQLLRERTAMLRYRYFICLVCGLPDVRFTVRVLMRWRHWIFILCV